MHRQTNTYASWHIKERGQSSACEKHKTKSYCATYKPCRIELGREKGLLVVPHLCLCARCSWACLHVCRSPSSLFASVQPPLQPRPIHKPSTMLQHGNTSHIQKRIAATADKSNPTCLDAERGREEERGRTAAHRLQQGSCWSLYAGQAGRLRHKHREESSAAAKTITATRGKQQRRRGNSSYSSEKKIGNVEQECREGEVTAGKSTNAGRLEREKRVAEGDRRERKREREKREIVVDCGSWRWTVVRLVWEVNSVTGGKAEEGARGITLLVYAVADIPHPATIVYRICRRAGRESRLAGSIPVY